jgi:cytochrome c5
MKSMAGSGEEVYQAHCASCHAEGVSGAPKTGDKEAWSGKIATGLDMLVNNAINGIGTMPAKGGDPNLSDEDVRAAVEYMVEQSR